MQRERNEAVVTLELTADSRSVHQTHLVPIIMKFLKSSAALLLALAAAQAASAQTTIRITGSTAFRSATIGSIQSLLASGYDVAFNGTAASSSNYSTFVGTYSGSPVVIQCAWSGSVDGIRDVTQNLNQTFIKASVVANTTAGTDSTASVSTSTAANVEQGVPDIAMADNTQTATPYRTPALTEIRVAVQPFVFVKGRVGASHPGKAGFDGINNITSQLAKLLLNGGVPLSFFTGAADASDTKIYALGRNPLSGTRVVTFAETGYGSTTTATQFKPVISGTTITGVNIYPAGSGFVDGNNGYSSGGTLAGELANTVVDTNGSGNLYDGQPFGFIGYVGIGDAGALLKAINTTVGTDVSYVLAYNGQSLPATYNNVAQTTSWDFSPIIQGKYSLWSYEYLSYLPTLSGLPKTFADALAANIAANVPASAGIKLSDLTASGVQRASEGAVITK